MTITRSDLAAWQSARTLADLGELTARWIEGDLQSQPGYYGPSDLDDPARLVPLLAKLNRVGYMTTQSQHACCGPGYDGAHWEQRAAVEGFIAGTAAMRAFASAVGGAGAGMLLVLHSPDTLPRWRYRFGDAVPVTAREGRACTWFGAQLPRRHIRDPHIGYGDCHPDAVRALCKAWQVTVTDPEWGRRELLWQVLERFISSPGGAR